MRCSDEVRFDNVGAGGCRRLWERRSCGAIRGRCSVARVFPDIPDTTATLVAGSNVRRCVGALPSQDLEP